MRAGDGVGEFGWGTDDDEQARSVVVREARWE